MADPAEQQVLVLPQGPADEVLQHAAIDRAIERVSLQAQVVLDHDRWQYLDAVVVVPWSHW